MIIALGTSAEPSEPINSRTGPVRCHRRRSEGESVEARTAGNAYRTPYGLAVREILTDPGSRRSPSCSAVIRDIVVKIVTRTRKHWFADLKAEALAWWVRRTADQRLQSVMRSPLRGVLLWLIFRTVRQRAQPAARVNAIVEFQISGRRDGGVDCYRLALTGGRGRRSRRAGQRPAVTLELEPVAFLRLVGGTASPQRLLLARKLKLRGDLMLALDLPTALRLPRSRPQMPSKR
jgi:hypothetical protein